MRTTRLVGEIDRAVYDVIMQGWQIFGVKWGVSCKHLEYNDAHRPPFGRKAVILTLNDLGWHVSRRSTLCIGKLVLSQDSSKAEVDHFEVTRLVNHQVVRLDISVHNVVLVKYVKCKDHLHCIKFDSFLWEDLLDFKHPFNWSSANEIHTEVHTLGRHEKVIHVAQKRVISGE